MFHIAPGVPINLHWRVHNQSVVEVEWSPPLTPNGLITKYWVEFRLNKSETHNKTTSDASSTSESEWTAKATTNTSIFLNELQRNEVYAVRVKAETKAGAGEVSEVALVRIFNKKPHEPPPPGDEPKPDPNHVVTDDQQRLGKLPFTFCVDNIYISRLYCGISINLFY